MQDTIIKITMSLSDKRNSPKIETLPIIYRGNGFYKCKGTSNRIFIGGMNQPLRTGSLEFTYYFIKPESKQTVWASDEMVNAIQDMKIRFDQEIESLSYLLERQYSNAILRINEAQEGCY